ncbi:hypothetical protein Tco_0271642 [Tanacetum coccineum]
MLLVSSNEWLIGQKHDGQSGGGIALKCDVEEFALMVSLLRWDDSAFSVFTTNSEEVEGRPLFNRFAKADLFERCATSFWRLHLYLDHIVLDEVTNCIIGTKSSTSGDSNSVSNDFVSCDNSDKSSEVTSNDFHSK